MCKVALFLFGLIFLFFIFIPQKAQAFDEDLVLSEVMVDPGCSFDRCEWIELFNNGETDLNLKDWFIDGKKIEEEVIIKSKQYLVVTKNQAEFLKAYPAFTLPLIEIEMSLNNSKTDSIIISNLLGTYQEEFLWEEPAGTNLSWERKSVDNNWLISLISGGTPGEENSINNLGPPLSPALLSPVNGENISGESSVLFSWGSQEDVNFQLLVSQNSDLSAPVLDITDLANSNYMASDLEFGSYYWAVCGKNLVGEKCSDIYNFSLIEPVYSNNIVINELMANPSGDESTYEYIELYNGSNLAVDLSNWQISDLEGSVSNYIFPLGTKIEAFGYFVIYRSQSGITLNNDNESLALYWPNKDISFTTPFSGNGLTDFAWARAPDGTFFWTSTPTPLKENIFTLPLPEEKIVETAVNIIPIEISTGEYEQYLDKLVKIKGKVTETSGSTFYLDDGSGQVKVYIQSKTGIKKPTMQKNDIFEITGIVDLYGATWRILPRVEDDIRLIEKAAVVIKKSTAKKVHAKVNQNQDVQVSVPKTVSGIAKENSNTKKEKTLKKYTQLIQTVLGLAVILLTVLIFKVKSQRKDKIIGGHFGDDMT